MPKLNSLVLLSALIAVNAASPAYAGTSEKIGPGHPDYPSSPGSAAYLNGGVVQDATIYGAPADQSYAMQSDGSSLIYGQQSTQYAGGDASAALDPTQMQSMQQMQQMQPSYQASGVANVDMGAPAVEMSGAMAGLGAIGGSGMNANPMGDGLSQAMTAAAAVGLLGSSAMNAMGDSLKGMGFGGGFRGHAMGASNRGRGYSRGGYSSGGGGGGITGTVNRALDRNINYAADQATRKLMWGLWH